MALPVRAFSLGIVLAVSHASTLFADPILITDNRAVLALALIVGGSPTTDRQTPSSPFAPFDGLASASAVDGLIRAQTVTTQRSSFGPGRLSVSGTVDSSATGAGESFEPGFSAGSSLFDVEFDLAGPHRYSLMALMAVDRTDASAVSEGFGEVDLALVTQLESGDVVVVGDGIRFGRRQLNVSGTLPKGRHRLFAEAFTESLSAGELSRHAPSFDLELAVTPVPEPGTLLLLGAGLAALASKRLTAH